MIMISYFLLDVAYSFPATFVIGLFVKNLTHNDVIGVQY